MPDQKPPKMHESVKIRTAMNQIKYQIAQDILNQAKTIF